MEHITDRILQIFDEDRAVKHNIMASLKRYPKQTIQDLCNSIGTDDDLKISTIIAELQIGKKIRSAGYVFFEREDGGMIIINKYEVS